MFKSSTLDSRVPVFGIEHPVSKAIFMLAIFGATSLKNRKGALVSANKKRVTIYTKGITNSSISGNLANRSYCSGSVRGEIWIINCHR